MKTAHQSQHAHLKDDSDRPVAPRLELTLARDAGIHCDADLLNGN